MHKMTTLVGLLATVVLAGCTVNGLVSDSAEAGETFETGGATLNPASDTGGTAAATAATGGTAPASGGAGGNSDRTQRGGDTSASTGGTANGGAPSDAGGTPTGGSTTSGTGGSSGQAGAPAEPPLKPAAGQRLLFEVAHANLAWGPELARSEGLFVTADGGVYGYTTPKPDGGTFGDLLIRKDQMTEEQVTAKYGPSPELLTTVPESDLLAMFALVAEARTGALFVMQCGNDAGVEEHVAWVYDPSTSLYSPVLLGTRRDICVANSNTAADTIMEWLCTLYEGTNCSAVRASQEVSSCDDCMATEVCVMTPDGKSHCSSGGCPPDECQTTFSCGTLPGKQATCDCAGAQVCSGGRAWCHQLDTAIFSCEAP